LLQIRGNRLVVEGSGKNGAQASSALQGLQDVELCGLEASVVNVAIIAVNGHEQGSFGETPARSSRACPYFGACP
jgi:hypothetical protein